MNLPVNVPSEFLFIMLKRATEKYSLYTHTCVACVIEFVGLLAGHKRTLMKLKDTSCLFS